MPTTTIDAIVDKMVSTVEDLTPTAHSRDSFRAWDEVIDDFREWADSNPGAAFRRFAIADTGEIDPQPQNTNMDVAEVWRRIEVVIAYPKRDATRYGTKPKRGRGALVNRDVTQVNHAIGTDGYSTLDQTTSGAATVFTEGQPSFEAGDGCVFAVLNLRVRFWEDMP